MNYPEESAIKMYVKILSFNRTILEEEIKEKPVEQNLSKNWTCKMTRCRLCWSVGNLSSVLGINGSQVCFSMFHFNNKLFFKYFLYSCCSPLVKNNVHMIPVVAAGHGLVSRRFLNSLSLALAQNFMASLDSKSQEGKIKKRELKRKS